jgi:hypothetical protein
MASIIDLSELRLILSLSDSITEQERAIVQGAVTQAEGAVKRFLGYDPTQRQRTEYYPRTDLRLGKGNYIWEVNDANAYVRQEAEEATNELQVQHIPIRETPAIDLRIDYDGRSGTRAGSFGAETLQTEGEDYWPNYDGLDSDGNRVCLDGILRSFGRWASEAGSVQIIYTAGYTDDELHGRDTILDASPIGEAVLNEAKRRVEGAFVRMKSSTLGWAAGPKTSESLGDYSYTIDSALASKLYGDSNSLMDQSRMALLSFQNMGWSLV